MIVRTGFVTIGDSVVKASAIERICDAVLGGGSVVYLSCGSQVVTKENFQDLVARLHLEVDAE